MVAQNRDPSPSIAPAASGATTTTTAGTQVSTTETTPSITGAPAPLHDKPIALRIVGSNVKNLKGEYLGLIEEIALNPESKQIEFALLNTEYPTNSGRVTPAPWQSLTYVWDQSQVGGTPGAVQLFRLDVEKARLAQAPKIDKTQFAQLLMPPFRQQMIAFYGSASESVGGTGTETVTSSGSASGGSSSGTSAATRTPGTARTGGYTGGYATTSPGLLVLGDGSTSTNRVPLESTNVVSTGTNVITGTNISNTGTNTIASGRTNIFQPRIAPFPPFPGTNGITNQGSIAANGNGATAGISNSVSGSASASNQVLNPGTRQPLDTGTGTGTGATGSGSTSQSGGGASGTRGAGNGVWSPPNTIIIPGQSTITPKDSTDGTLTLPPPPGALPLPDPVGPLPFPPANRAGSLPPAASPSGAVPPTSGAK